jgi:hypothetical protein
MAGLAEALLSSVNLWSDDPATPAKIRRAEEVIMRAELLSPEERLVMGVRVNCPGPSKRALGLGADVVS